MNDINEIFKILFSRKIILFSGEYGRGKTLSATSFIFLNLIMNDVNKILSNIPFKFGDFFKGNIEPFINTSLLDNENKNSIIMVDEMQRYFNSREFLGASNKIFAKWSVDLRKDESQIIGTIQYMNRLDTAVNEIVQIIIIPSFLNHYSNDDIEDNKKRIEKKDFLVNWHIIDKKFEDKYDIKLNLYPYLNMYLTKFKPLPLIIDNSEFLENKEKSLSQLKYENLLILNQKKYNESLDNWNNGMKELNKYYE